MTRRLSGRSFVSEPRPARPARPVGREHDLHPAWSCPIRAQMGL